MDSPKINKKLPDMTLYRNVVRYKCITKHKHLILIWGPSWWYGSWTYNYPCTRCLSPLKLWVRIPFRRGVLDTTLCDKVCQWLATGWWFSLGSPVSSTNKTDSHDRAEILLKAALKTIRLTLTALWYLWSTFHCFVLQKCGSDWEVWPPRYNWNIVECGVKHHKLTISTYIIHCYHYNNKHHHFKDMNLHQSPNQSW